MKYTVLHNARCGKSREAIQFLEANAIDFTIREYLKEPLSFDELQKIISILKINPIDLVRTNETEWKDLFKGKELTDEEIINAMIDYPKLIQRPVIFTNKKGIIGRPFEKIEEFLKEK